MSSRLDKILMLLAVLSLAGCGADRPPAPAPRLAGLDAAGFRALLERVADGWNRGDARAAADCFATDAVYVEPPRKQVYEGREALYEFFGGGEGRAGQMSMRWHTIVFDPDLQRGMAEFTFDYGGQVHGVVIADVAEGRIAQWREYWYESSLPFEEFVKPGRP